MNWQALNLTKPADISNAAVLADLQAMATKSKSVLIHPFQFGIGEGEKPNLLSFPNAVDALAVKIDEEKPEALTCVAFADNSIAGLSAKLENAVNEGGLNWLLTPGQKAKLLTSLEQEKLVIVEPSTVQTTFRQDHSVLHIGKIAECYQSKAKEIALSESAAAVENIATELSNFETKKSAHDTQINAEYALVDSGSASGYALKIVGGDIASQLIEASSPGTEKSQTVIIGFMGTETSLKLINQWAGL